jgi:hypothetical protein
VKRNDDHWKSEKGQEANMASANSRMGKNVKSGLSSEEIVLINKVKSIS